MRRTREPVLPPAAQALAAAVLCGACRALPPPVELRAQTGVVRAADAEESLAVAEMLDALAPRVRALVPGSRSIDLEVWIQEAPALYRFPSTSMQDADGFWAEEARQIHLRRGADDLERTLAHELAHASLGRDWSALPGTLEEGLCDAVSARLCPRGAARLRAGRLTAAALATGGLALQVEVDFPGGPEGEPPAREGALRLFLSGEAEERIDPLRVFRVQAGSSSARIRSEEKRAFYGLAFLCAERIVERAGIDGLRDLCRRARDEGRISLGVESILAAAGLTPEPQDWKRAAAEALQPEDLAEIVRMHPALLGRVLAEILSPAGPVVDACASLQAPLQAPLAARLRVPGGASVDLLSIPEVALEIARLSRIPAAPRIAAD